MYDCLYFCLYVCLYVYIYIYIHIYTHTYPNPGMQAAAQQCFAQLPSVCVCGLKLLVYAGLRH